MRRSSVLVLAAFLALGCGGDDAEPATDAAQRPTPQRPAMDSARLDSIRRARAEAARQRTAEEQAGQAQTPPARAGAPAAGPGARPSGARPSGAAPATGSSGRLYTVQVAAFTDAAAAREWTRRLASQDMPVWTSMAEIGGRTFYRVRVGTVGSVADARRLGALLSARYEWPVWVAPVTPADSPPANAAAETRRLLSAGS